MSSECVGSAIPENGGSLAKMFPRITNGKVYLPFGGTTPDGADADGMYELSPEDPTYEARG
jgi:hypothetical protein